MIDPVTAISIATNAFGTIKRMVEAGRDVEDTLTQVGRWYGAVSDLNECQRRAENPPLFKKMLHHNLLSKKQCRYMLTRKKYKPRKKNSAPC